MEAELPSSAEEGGAKRRGGGDQELIFCTNRPAAPCLDGAPRPKPRRGVRSLRLYVQSPPYPEIQVDSNQ